MSKPYGLEIGVSGEWTRRLTFVVEKSSCNGWADMRLIEIYDTPSDKTVVYTASENYDPHSYMGKVWKARACVDEDNMPTYALYGAFGEPGSRMMLTPYV
jgi:hypothetical protein